MQSAIKKICLSGVAGAIMREVVFVGKNRAGVSDSRFSTITRTGGFHASGFSYFVDLIEIISLGLRREIMKPAFRSWILGRDPSRSAGSGSRSLCRRLFLIGSAGGRSPRRSPAALPLSLLYRLNRSDQNRRALGFLIGSGDPQRRKISPEKKRGRSRKDRLEKEKSLCVFLNCLNNLK